MKVSPSFLLRADVSPGRGGKGSVGFKMVVNKVISGAVRSPAGQRGSRCGGEGTGTPASPVRRPAGDAPWVSVSRLVWGRAGKGRWVDAAGAGPGASGIRAVRCARVASPCQHSPALGGVI